MFSLQYAFFPPVFITLCRCCQRITGFNDFGSDVIETEKHNLIGVILKPGEQYFPVFFDIPIW